ncbi:2-amino-4-hydroxy-6-hydroxymethyldihydropteridine pyrophosphokinase [Desulfosarcina alkanivorans]|jgi:2-amino-4-hydroxy-6-hydroxymethyldihydropteridine diphosphokinase|uniref:2-amino-4-hydroxy-6-hydroxymethyldihydropteridine pyrophosphokinase n=1 Tax=Desulfosarcina alkanivorans TaxID=571177 RepID=A0A5K7YCL6_9BACT|nr:2-amino-4-hydroxy-6-hydroxymethyldihydropteridine diphosphokinase [Desulfosarcina alkanivorans]BBO66165.1 2-amino-4-hydroxy-6-hydroxymethyldihydropteridine pyrophosphokinase [Desulfosarcina alkanivorans]
MADLSDEPVVYISVGSNLGDKLENCLSGIAALTDSGKSTLLETSRFYRTSPVDYTEQDWFVNAAVKIRTTLAPLNLLDELVAIQQRRGRKADMIRFGPRVLDLDILMYGDRVIRTPRLEIPHPRMHKRAFVLQPICDIDPTIIHPALGKTVGDLLGRLNDDDQRVVPLDNPPTPLQGGMP